MEKVTTINVGGRVYHVEERGYDALRAYLAEAAARLAEDPSRDEILADLEHAIAEKCDALLSAHKTVITQAEVARIVEAMGPVEGNGKDAPAPQTAAPSQPKRLYLILDGAMIAGVCTGLAAYFDLDVTIVRILFVLLTLLTGGIGVLLYMALAVVVPYADTAEALAQARGEALNAQALVNRAKQRFEESFERVTGHSSQWHDKHTWKQWKREQKRTWRIHKRAQGPAHRLLGILLGGLSLMWIFALLSLISTRALFGWTLPASIPLWAALVGLFILYFAVTGPMKAARYAPYYPGYQYHYSAWEGIEAGLTVLFLAIVFVWAYATIPAVSAFVLHPIAGTEHAMSVVSTWAHSLQLHPQ